MSSYTIGVQDGHAFIQCHRCGSRSFNVNDIDNRYCGRCRVFHEVAGEPVCQHCGEPILPGEPIGPVQNALLHHECFFRSVAGSVGHQKHECSCYDQTDTSEYGLTKRQAAKAALEYYRSRQPASNEDAAWPWEAFQRGNFRHG